MAPRKKQEANKVQSAVPHVANKKIRLEGSEEKLSGQEPMTVENDSVDHEDTQTSIPKKTGPKRAPRKKKAAKKVQSPGPHDANKIRLEESEEKLSEQEPMTEENDSVDLEDTQTSNLKRPPRGKTRMHCLQIQRALGVKKEVVFNDLGQPFGDAATQMQSYIGVLARERVKITYDCWTQVPIDIKEKIWESVIVSNFVSG